MANREETVVLLLTVKVRVEGETEEGCEDNFQQMIQRLKEYDFCVRSSCSDGRWWTASWDEAARSRRSNVVLAGERAQLALAGIAMAQQYMSTDDMRAGRNILTAVISTVAHACPTCGQDRPSPAPTGP